MSFCDSLRDGCGELWQELHRHPFLRELADGTLAPERFRFFLEQDIFFLPELARAVALGVARSATTRKLAHFADELAAVGGSGARVEPGAARPGRRARRGGPGRLARAGSGDGRVRRLSRLDRGARRHARDHDRAPALHLELRGHRGRPRGRDRRPPGVRELGRLLRERRVRGGDRRPPGHARPARCRAADARRAAAPPGRLYDEHAARARFLGDGVPASSSGPI